MTIELTANEWLGLCCSILTFFIVWALAKTPKATLKKWATPKWETPAEDAAALIGLVVMAWIMVVGYEALVHLIYAEIAGFPYNRTIGMMLAMTKVVITFCLILLRAEKPLAIAA